MVCVNGVAFHFSKDMWLLWEGASSKYVPWFLDQMLAACDRSVSTPAVLKFQANTTPMRTKSMHPLPLTAPPFFALELK
jgi:hypothetical protein